MFAILHALGMFVADQFKSRSRLEAENLFLRHQLNIALRRASPRLRGSDRTLLIWITRLWPSPGCGIPDDPASDGGPTGLRASPKGILSTKAAHRMLVRSVTLRHGFSCEPTMEKQNENWRNQQHIHRQFQPIRNGRRQSLQMGPRDAGQARPLIARWGRTVGAIMRSTD
jgi:hypothetical protein